MFDFTLYKFRWNNLQSLELSEKCAGSSCRDHQPHEFGRGGGTENVCFYGFMVKYNI